MADILTGEQVNEKVARASGVVSAICANPDARFEDDVIELVATLRHVQAELEDARKESWDAWADEHNSLREENARLQAELEQTKKWANGVAKKATDVVKKNARLQAEFDSYKQTAEEINQCYSNSHSDSWVFEQALRRITNKSLEDSDNLGESSVEEQRTVALKALEAIWKRREERSRQALATEGEGNG